MFTVLFQLLPGSSVLVWGGTPLRPVSLYCHRWVSTWRGTGRRRNIVSKRLHGTYWRSLLASYVPILRRQLVLLRTTWIATSLRPRWFQKHHMPTWTVKGRWLTTSGLSQKEGTFHVYHYFLCHLLRLVWHIVFITERHLEGAVISVFYRNSETVIDGLGYPQTGYI